MPELVYETDRVSLWFGDAREVLPAIAKESVHLVLTDPPYGKEWQSRQRSEQFAQLLGDGAHEDDRAAVAEVLQHCVRIVGQNRHLYVFGPTDVLEGQKVSEVVELIWDKGVIGSGDVTSPWGPQFERISFCTSKSYIMREAQAVMAGMPGADWRMGCCGALVHSFDQAMEQVQL